MRHSGTAIPPIQLYALAYPVTSLGPGRRIVLWVAGCILHCPGCISPEMQDAAGGRPIAVERLADRLLHLDPNHAGLTISGGEPFEQAPALSQLLDEMRRERPDWSVMVYTGHVLEDLSGDPERAALLSRIDVLIDGPYRADAPSTYALAGSGNQRFHYLTSRGRDMRAAIERFPRHSVNIGLGRGDLNIIIGVTAPSMRQAIERALTGSCGDRDGKAC